MTWDVSYDASDDYEPDNGGISYLDSGVRVNTSDGVITIGGIDLEESNEALRIHTSSGNIGFPLVEVDDPTASPVRVKTATGIKAIAKKT